MEEQNIEKQLYGWPKPAPQHQSSTRMNQERLGIGLGNINTMMYGNNMPQQHDPRQTMIDNENDIRIAQQIQDQQHGVRPTQRFMPDFIMPMLDKNQNVGWQAHADVSPNLDYLRYGGKIGGRLGDMSVVLNDSNQTAQGYRANSQGAMLQFTPQELAGFVAQAGVQHDTNRFGYDKNTTSVGVGYSNPRASNFSGNLSASRSIDNSGIPDEQIKANIGYRW